jgi:transmembrane protein 33
MPGWFVGHVTLLIATLRYGLSYMTFRYYSRWAQFSYRTAFVAAAATYGIVVFKGYRARQKSGKAPSSPVQLIADENVQYLGTSYLHEALAFNTGHMVDYYLPDTAMALVWLFSRQTALALLPFAVYSVFHVATYTRGILLPTIQPPPPTPAGQKPKSSALSDGIGRFVKDYYDASMSLVAGLEIALWFRLLGSAIIFQKGSWILLTVYTVFLRARIGQSTFVQGMLHQIGARGDQLAQRQDVPPAVRQGWETFKGAAKTAHEQTDPAKYFGGQQAPAKKAQ